MQLVLATCTNVHTSMSTANDVIACLQVWLGHFQSVRPLESGLTLNVDITATAFLQSRPCMNHLLEMAGMANLTSKLTASSLRDASEAFHGIKVWPPFSGCKRFFSQSVTRPIS